MALLRWSLSVPLLYSSFPFFRLWCIWLSLHDSLPTQNYRRSPLITSRCHEQENKKVINLFTAGTTTIHWQGVVEQPWPWLVYQEVLWDLHHWVLLLPIIEPENQVMGHPVSISLLHHHPMWELLPVLLLVPQMDLMKRIWFWNYVHWVVCESLCEASHRAPPLI